MTTQDDTRTTGPLTRRELLTVGASSLAVMASGCLGDGDDDPTETPADDDGEPLEATSAVPDTPAVENPPEAVYLPTHREAMRHLDPVQAGPYTVGPMITYPHQFWTVTGAETQVVRPQNRGVHLMYTVWETETGTVLPVDIGTEMQTHKDDTVVDTRSPWPMISQTMGFHFGDNVPLQEDGTYTVDVTLNPITTRRTGEFSGQFGTEQSVSFEFEYNEQFRREVTNGVTYLDEQRWGETGALEPMGGGMAQGEHDGDTNMSNRSNKDSENGDNSMNHGMMMPFSALPSADSYPGQSAGPTESGDAKFVVTYLEESPVPETDEGYLVVSPRTPYNSIPLADMALSVTGAVNGELTQTIDSELGHHYGLSTTLSEGERLELVVESPPQVARHRGYETAFMDMPPMTIEMPE